MTARETSQGEEVWTIREVFYDGTSWTDAITPSGDSYHDLLEALRKMLLDAERRDFLDLDIGRVSPRGSNKGTTVTASSTAATPVPLTKEAIKRVQQIHSAALWHDSTDLNKYTHVSCSYCGEEWPCTTIRLIRKR